MLRWTVAFLLAPALGAAQEAQDKTSSGFVPIPGVEYYCTDSTGARREMGELLCITAGCDTWLAKCDMSLNSPMWRKVQDGCPGAGLHERLKALKPTV